MIGPFYILAKQGWNIPESIVDTGDRLAVDRNTVLFYRDASPGGHCEGYTGSDSCVGQRLSLSSNLISELSGAEAFAYLLICAACSSALLHHVELPVCCYFQSQAHVLCKLSARTRVPKWAPGRLVKFL